jgi:hypothetical protein
LAFGQPADFFAQQVLSTAGFCRGGFLAGLFLPG